MRRARATAGTVLVLSAVGACGDPAGSEGGASQDAPPPVVVSSTEPPPPPVSPAKPPAPTPAVDAGADAATLPSIDDWARYVIQAGAHSATVMTAAAGNPRAGFVNGLAARVYDLVLDASAIYTITQPVQPNDQLDWNKLPGLSDCGNFDLAKDGLMFGWRWRIDLAPNVLEVTAYANADGLHQTPAAPMLTLDAADLASKTALRYHLWMDGSKYHFSISGTVRGRTISATSDLPRRCASTPPTALVVQWASGLYFGGTSTAPATITSHVFEL